MCVFCILKRVTPNPALFVHANEEAGKTKKCKSVIELLVWSLAAYSRLFSFTLGKCQASSSFPVEEKERVEGSSTEVLALKFTNRLQCCCEGSVKGFLFIPGSKDDEPSSTLICNIFSRLFCMCTLFTCVPWAFSQLCCVNKMEKRKSNCWYLKCQIIPVIFSEPPTGKKVNTDSSCHNLQKSMMSSFLFPLGYQSW